MSNWFRNLSIAGVVIFAAFGIVRTWQIGGTVLWSIELTMMYLLMPIAWIWIFVPSKRPMDGPEADYADPD
jgi:hypothetical protein